VLHLYAEDELVACAAHGVVLGSCGPCAYSCATLAAVVCLCGGGLDVGGCAFGWACPVEDVLELNEDLYGSFVVLV
jgi:hypothetical protein